MSYFETVKSFGSTGKAGRNSMRPVYITMAAVTALSLASPASAQWGHDRTYSEQLRLQIDAGVKQGTISPPENVRLRGDLGRLVNLERRFSPNGISGREHAVLMRRSTALAKEIRVANRHGNARNQTASSDAIMVDHGNWAADPRFARPNAGDRFAGDVRVGQHATGRIVTVPVQYRGDYVDNDRVYYGYDNGRIYQIDRQSQMITALLDIVTR
jgi:hypothetical protein